MTEHETAKSADQKAEIASAVKGVAADIRDAAAHKFDQTVAEVRTRADDAKTDVATEVRDVARALRHAAEELRGGSAQERTLGQIADGLADASDAIRDKDLGEIVDMVRRVGRDHPALFLGGAALVGFAASRYLKASADRLPVDDPARSDRSRPVDTFINEGNPNTQPVGAMP